MSYPDDVPCKTNNCNCLVPFYFKDVLCKKCRRYYTGYFNGSYYVIVEMLGNHVLKFDDDINQRGFSEFLRTYYNKNILTDKIHLHVKKYWLRKISWKYTKLFDNSLPAEISEKISVNIAENIMEGFM